MTRRLKDGLATHSLLRLGDISMHFPANADQAYLAYAQSWNLIDYIYTTFGQAKMAALIRAMNNPQSDFGSDVTQALGVDVPHLENQWRLHLNQPPTLTAAQIQPTAQTVNKPVTSPAMTDNSAPFLFLLGGLLILLPILGMGGLFVYQRRSRAKALAAQQMQYSSHTNLAARNAAMGPVFTTNPGSPFPPPSYPAARQQPPYTRTEPDIRAVRPAQAPLKTPSPQWGPPPVPSTGRGSLPGNALPEQFIRAREYSGHNPNRQAPQE
jgi:hypothetical protein